MGKDLLIGLSATFLLWVGAVLWASSRLVYMNWSLYRVIRNIDRDTRVKMALWLAIPMLMAGIMWQRAFAFYAAIFDLWTTNFGITGTLIYLFDALAALALALWWAFDRTYGPRKGDLLWCRLMWMGVLLGGVVSLLSWWF